MGKLRFPFCCASPDSGRWGFKRHRCKICKKSRREVLGGPCVKKKKRNDSTELRAEIWAEVGKERKKNDLGKSELRDCSGTTWWLRCLLRPHSHGERELKLLPPLFPQLGRLTQRPAEQRCFGGHLLKQAVTTWQDCRRFLPVSAEREEEI